MRKCLFPKCVLHFEVCKSENYFLYLHNAFQPSTDRERELVFQSSTSESNFFLASCLTNYYHKRLQGFVSPVVQLVHVVTISVQSLHIIKTFKKWKEQKRKHLKKSPKILHL